MDEYEILNLKKHTVNLIEKQNFQCNSFYEVDITFITNPQNRNENYRPILNMKTSYITF